MNNYPPGAANDPDAPYNQPLDETYTITVSITLSKTFTIDITKHEDRPINEVDVRLSYYLPDEILEIISNDDTEYNEMVLKHIKQYAKDWIVDDLAIVEE